MLRAMIALIVMTVCVADADAGPLRRIIQNVKARIQARQQCRQQTVEYRMEQTVEYQQMVEYRAIPVEQTVEYRMVSAPPVSAPEVTCVGGQCFVNPLRATVIR